MNLYFLKFKNYYSRELKYYNNLNSYKDYVVSAAQEVNFNPNDGINAVQDQVVVDASCDYLICTEYDVVGEENIVSRWYIIEATRQLGGYYRLTLRRDVLADYWSLLLDAPAFIEKATLADSDPLIFNKENVRTNQIKQSETLLKDSLQCAWICGYIKKDYPGATIEIEANAIADLDKASWGMDSFINKSVYNFNNQDTYYFYALDRNAGETWYEFAFKYTLTSSGWKLEDYNGPLNNLNAGYVNIKYTDVYKILSFLNTSYGFADVHAVAVTDVYSEGNGYSAADYNNIINLNNKTLQDNGLFYTINASANHAFNTPAIVSGTTLFNYFKNIYSNTTYFSSYVGAPTHTQVSLDSTRLTLTPIASGKYSITIPAATARNHLSDAPYDMFCIPYDCLQTEVSDTSKTYITEWDKKLAISFAQGIAEKVSNQYIIDIQLLPYHPDPTNISLQSRPGGAAIKYNMHGDDATFNLIKNASGTPIGGITWATKSSGTINIYSPITSGNKKLDNQTRFYRLCSPNWNGQFEFTPEMVGEKLSYFNVDYTYLPYQPYIHVAPIFEKGSMYGNDYNDARGLICGGNFSVSYLSDKWAEYQIANKNYANIFDRQIQNMEKTYDIQQRYWGLDLVAGALQTGATVGGIAAGATGPIGAAALGIGTAAGSLVSGLMGHDQDKALHNEAIDFAKDNYKMQLDNIKALPDSLTKVGVINENNKIYPVLEEYNCTTLERKALANKIRYNGMTAGIISKISDYTINSWTATIDGETIKDKGFIKGYFIQIPKLGEDYHLMSALSEELNKGIYLKED